VDLVNVRLLRREMDVVKDLLADGAEKLVRDKRLNDCVQIAMSRQLSA